jgi:CheY-like chemotaxis protein
LATVYGIVKQSGGNTWVFSEPGRGTTFEIYLPRVDDPVESLELRTAATASRCGSETILLVEDDDRVRTLVRAMLQKFGYRVLEATDGSVALQVCDRHEGPIHLLLTDVIMPQLSGKELAERITEVRPDINVLFMSGYTDNHIATHGILDEGVALIQKPFSETELLKTVRIVLESGTKLGPTA